MVSRAAGRTQAQSGPAVAGGPPVHSVPVGGTRGEAVMSTPPMLVIGICGASASGKTTFTKKVLRAVDPAHVAHVPHDAYYHGPEAMPAELREARNFDHPRALDTDLLVRHLQDLREGRAVGVPVYDFAAHRRT